MCVLSLSSGVHDDIGITGCSQSDGEEMYGLDGEEKWYADFEKEVGVEIQVPFGGRFIYEEGTYEVAVANQQICKTNLEIRQQFYKNATLRVGKYLNIFLSSSPSFDQFTLNFLIHCVSSCHIIILCIIILLILLIIVAAVVVVLVVDDDDVDLDQYTDQFIRFQYRFIPALWVTGFCCSRCQQG